jgi:hypothetical protein
VLEFVNAAHFDAALAVSRGEPAPSAERLAPPTAPIDEDDVFVGIDPADAVPF